MKENLGPSKDPITGFVLGSYFSDSPPGEVLELKELLAAQLQRSRNKGCLLTPVSLVIPDKQTKKNIAKITSLAKLPEDEITVSLIKVCSFVAAKTETKDEAFEVISGGFIYRQTHRENPWLPDNIEELRQLRFALLTCQVMFDTRQKMVSERQEKKDDQSLQIKYT